MPMCSICEEIQGREPHALPRSYRDLVKSGQTILASTLAFAVLPSVGALNDSHVMIVSKQHATSMAALAGAAWEELVSVMDQLRSFAREAHSWDLMFFEHGAGFNVDSSGACVDHAHVHAIRFQFDILRELRRAAPLVRLPSLDSAPLVANKSRGYILLVDEQANCWLANNPNLPSQYFRMLYSRAQKGPEVWNWRSDPRTREVSKAIHAYASLRLAHV